MLGHVFQIQVPANYVFKKIDSRISISIWDLTFWGIPISQAADDRVSLLTTSQPSLVLVALAAMNSDRSLRQRERSTKPFCWRLDLPRCCGKRLGLNPRFWIPPTIGNIFVDILVLLISYIRTHVFWGVASWGYDPTSMNEGGYFVG